MTSPAWAAVFRRASTRCRTLGIDLDVTPHALRHYLPRPTMSGSFRPELQTSEEQGGFLQKHPGHPT
jgi:integrase